MTAVTAFGGRLFDLPIDLVPLPDGRYLLAEQGGQVLLLDESGQGEVVLEVSGRVATGHEELGLLAVTPDPAFDRNEVFWVHYIAPDPLRNVVSRHSVDGEVDEVILTVPQPYENHNGGAMRFGPDGMLYVSIGDGGDAWDPHGHGQDRATLLSTILRLDVTSEPGTYLVPADNPFVGQEGVLPEIWAYGLRNTWRFEFDDATGELWGGDVGQDEAEEVNLLRAGGNYGWSAYEGDRCRVSSCEGIDAIPPVVSYDHSEGCAIIGGFVYRGSDLPLDGQYLYADLCSGSISALPEGGDPHVVLELTPPVVGLARGHLGEVFVLRQGEAIVRLIVEE